MVLHNVRKVSVWKHTLKGVWGHAPQENFGIKDLRDRICWVFRPSKCSENNIHFQHSGSVLVAIQLSRKLLLVLNVSDPRLFRSCADSFVRGANKL